MDLRLSSTPADLASGPPSAGPSTIVYSPVNFPAISKQSTRHSPAMNVSRLRGDPWITRLPNELLEKVFIHLRDELMYGELAYGCKSSHSWAQVCLVCRDWNIVATQCSSLWSHIISVPWYHSSASYIEAMICRSRQHPLSLHVSPQSRTMCLDLLQKHNACQRLTAVALNRTYAPAGSRYVEADKRQASLSAPNLRELTLAYDWPREESIGNQKRRRPLPFSLGELPHLSSFIASRAPFSDIRTFFRPTITHLSLLHLFERIPTDQFLSALKNMPLLEVLELHTALSPFDGRHIRPHHFQHLRRLAFADCMATLADYLTSLVFRASSLESIEISCEPLQCNTPQDGPMLPHRLRSIVGRLRGLLREPMRSMHIHNKESHNSPLEIAGWSTSDVPSSTIRPLLELKIAERNGRHDVLELIIVALSEMEVENVRTLTYGFLDVPKDPIRRVRIPLPLYLEEYGMVYSRFIRTEVITIDLGLAPRLRDAMMMRFPLDWQEIRQRLVHWFEYLDELPETGLPEEGQENRKFLFPAIKTVIVQWKQSFSRDQGTTMEHLRKQFAEASAFRGQEIEILSNVLPASSTMNNFVFFG